MCSGAEVVLVVLKSLHHVERGTLFSRVLTPPTLNWYNSGKQVASSSDEEEEWGNEGVSEDETPSVFRFC